MDHPAFHNSHPATTANCNLAQSIPSRSSEGTSSGGPESTASTFRQQKTLGLGVGGLKMSETSFKCSCFSTIFAWYLDWKHQPHWVANANCFIIAIYLSPNGMDFAMIFSAKQPTLDKGASGFLYKSSQCEGAWDESDQTKPEPTCNSWFCGKHLQNLLLWFH